MWCRLCILFIFYTTLVNTELVLNSENKNVNLTTNVTVTSKIVSESAPKQSEIAERSLLVINKSDIANVTKIKKMDDFVPSPQIGGFENNFSLNQQTKSLEPSTNNWVANAWAENSGRQAESSIEAPWKSTKVKFPAPTDARPYAFDNSYNKSPVVTNPIELVYKQPTVLPPPSVQQYFPQVYPSPPVQHFPQMYPIRPNTATTPPQSMWKKLLSFTGLDSTRLPSPKSFFGDYSSYGGNHVDQSSYKGDYNSGNHIDQSLYHGGDHHSYQGYYNTPKEHHHSVDSYGGKGMNPWKKILKVLAAIIPIGLFLSALTPTIITVSSANDTISRYRKDDSPESVMNTVATSLHTLQKLHQDSCEERVLCVLMVNAMFSKNAEEHIKNLLDNFVKGSDPSETTFMKILGAVKNQDCSSIICKDMEDPT